ncbi:MAG: glutathione transferase GstA [Hyphomicrobiaceae bacterium]|nr:MAG: glutathione transferase GstA [Hyphomicrobiaceae bacterium]
MKLYYSPGACSLSPHIVLRELGQKFDLVKVDLATKKTESGADYKSINPFGYVPALDVDGQVLTEGPAIVQYLADKAGKLAPANGTLERYRLQQWLNFTTSELHKGMGSLFNKDLAAKAGDIVKERLALRLQVLDNHLKGKDFILGKEYSVVDAYVFTVLGWAKFVDVDLSKYANIGAYLGRVGARPAVQAALKAEGLVK